MEDQFITVKEAAKYFRCSTSTIKRHLRSGKLQGIQTPGGHWSGVSKTCFDLPKEKKK